WDPTLGGLDWEALRAELRPRVERATSRDEARRVIEELLRRLGQSHFTLLPAGLYHQLGEPGGGSEPTAGSGGDPGFQLRAVEGLALVTSVRAGSPAEAAGVRPGWALEEVRGEQVAPLVAQVLAERAGRAGVELLLDAALRGRLRGSVGDRVPVAFLDGADREVRLDLPLEAEKGSVARLGYLPPTRVWVESRRLPGNVGLIAFNLFLDPGTVMPRFAAAVESFVDADGVVLDLRGNPGGIGGMATGIAGWFVDQPGRRLGTMTTRETSLSFVVFPRPRTYSGPLAILVDGLSASTAEILAGGLQDLGRARVFGTRTAAMALPSRIDRLPNGDGFQYAIANYVSAGGVPLEGQGVVPDEQVAPTRALLLSGRDPALDAAVAWVEAQAAKRDAEKARTP
ncbi:MAG: S41 family peptidase, partial [Acidimicrobiales bacterium]|nr:S41 family peptidase [Acidimicrobiales bacterium]